MAGVGAGRVRRRRRLPEGIRLSLEAAGLAPEDWRDWAGLPELVLVKVAEALVAQNEAGWAAWLKREAPGYWTEERLQERMAKRKADGNCLFVFARVCKQWRKAQLKVGGPLRTRVRSDVILPGSLALAAWALGRGCPGRSGCITMASVAAEHGHLELVKWLFGLFKINVHPWYAGGSWRTWVMAKAAGRGNLQLVQWLRGEGCPWCSATCEFAVHSGHVEVLRWARENGCQWNAETRDRAAAELGYTDDFGNLDGWPYI